MLLLCLTNFMSSATHMKLARLFPTLLGPVMFGLILLFFHPEGMSAQSNAVLACTAWIAIWWIFEVTESPQKNRIEYNQPHWCGRIANHTGVHASHRIYVDVDIEYGYYGDDAADRSGYYPAIKRRS